jgi:hypothetical protein
LVEASDEQDRRGDGGDAGRQAIHRVDEVHSIDHPHRPEDAERQGNVQGKRDEPAEGAGDVVDHDAEDHRRRGHRQVSCRLRPGPEPLDVVDQRQRYNEREAGQKAEQAHLLRRRAREEEQADGQCDQKPADHRVAASTRGGPLLQLARTRPVDEPETPADSLGDRR